MEKTVGEQALHRGTPSAGINQFRFDGYALSPYLARR